MNVHKKIEKHQDTHGGGLHPHGKYEESKHKRGMGGKFATKPGEAKPKSLTEKNAKLQEKGKTSGVTDQDVIKLHVDNNPKKPGSQAHNDFSMYKDGMTVGEFKSTVGKNASGHLIHDTKKGFISIHDPKTLPKEKIELTKAQYIASGKQSGIQGSDVVKLHPTEEIGHNANPKKPGSKAAQDFGKYKDEMTVDEFHAAVGDKGAAKGHITHDIKKGHISVHDPKDLKALRTGEKTPSTLKAEPKPEPEVTKPGEHSKEEKSAAKTSAVHDHDLKSDASVLHDDHVLTSTFSGDKVTVKSYLDNHKSYNPNHSDIQAKKVLQKDIDDGFYSVSAPTPKAEHASAIDVKHLKPEDDLYLITSKNPYPKPSAPQGTALPPDQLNWVKYQSFTIKPNQKMNLSDYQKTQAGTPEEKAAALQSMINQGHIKVVTGADKKAALAATEKAAQEALASKHKVHLEAVKESTYDQWKDDPKWGNAPGVHTTLKNATYGSDLYPEHPQMTEMMTARKAMGLKFNNNSNSAVAFYTGSGYSGMNKALRKGESTYDYADRVKQLDSLMETTKGDAIMWRGIGSDSFHGSGNKHGLNDIPPPQEVTDMGYSSISYNPRISKSFAGQSKIHGTTTLFRVRVPAGTKAAFVGRVASEKKAMTDEAEVITARGTRYRYVSTTHGVNVGGNNVTVIDMEIVKAD
jgi:hypothetical protein